MSDRQRLAEARLRSARFFSGNANRDALSEPACRFGKSFRMRTRQWSRGPTSPGPSPGYRAARSRTGNLCVSRSGHGRTRPKRGRKCGSRTSAGFEPPCGRRTPAKARPRRGRRFRGIPVDCTRSWRNRGPRRTRSSRCARRIATCAAPSRSRRSRRAPSRRCPRGLSGCTSSWAPIGTRGTTSGCSPGWSTLFPRMSVGCVHR